MKIPQSVRLLYRDVRPLYDRLKVEVDKLLSSNKPARWHYESRLKAEESFALKLETGRVRDPNALEDFFACTLVVENRSRVDDAEALIKHLFCIRQRRPADRTKTHLAPSSFEFDDLRLYVSWKDDPSTRPTGLDGILFEVQVKTFLQHAWGIAIHDFIYKADDVDWSGARIAYQVKAMLENAELSISEAKRLASSTMLAREDRAHASLSTTIVELRKRWPPDRLPTDMKRLAQTIENSAKSLTLRMDEVWAILDRATAQGAGAETLDLSPYGAIIAALVQERGAALFDPLNKLKASIFVPDEVSLPTLPANINARIVRTAAASAGLSAQIELSTAEDERS